MNRKVGFIGLGHIGAPIAERVAKGGYQLAIYARRQEVIRRFVDKGAEVASSPGELATRCREILLCLPDSSATEEVLLGKDGIIEGASSGTLVIDLSSGHPEKTVHIGKQLAGRGIEIIDAPVSGGRFGAEAGTLTAMAGGRKVLFEQSRPILSTFSSQIFYCGELGSGQTIKTVSNMLSATCFLATAEAMILATKAGLDPETALDVVNASSGQSRASETRFRELVLRGDFDKAKAGSMRLYHKDLSIATDLGMKLGVPMFIANVIRELLAYGVAKAGPEVANTRIVPLMEEWAGVKVRAKEALAKE